MHPYQVQESIRAVLGCCSIDERMEWRLGSQYKQKTQIHHTPYTNILLHSKAKKNTTFNNGRYTTNVPTDTHT